MFRARFFVSAHFSSRRRCVINLGCMVNEINYSLPEKLENAVQLKFADWKSNDKIGRLWQKDASLWTNADEAQWLGWLDIVDERLNAVSELEKFQEEVRQREFSHILLLGMGGSSLCPEVLAKTFGRQEGFPELLILDSTVPAQIKAVESKINPEKTLFIVASKSGSTLEPNTFKQYFFELLSAKIGRENAGKQFVAVTDPNSKMQKIAESDGFWKIFYGVAEIGGRFSALSNFGLVPAAAMGLNVRRFLENARQMVEKCRTPQPEENSGVALGVILGTAQTAGRDKLTIFAAPEIYDLGAWLEQLIAESTGKNDVSIIPVDREPIQPAENYGEDRVFVYLKVKNSASDFDEPFAALEASGLPCVRIELESKMHLGQEFFRWEMATAAAGSIMKINTFNQPDVESAKIEARKLTDEYEKTGEMPDEKPIFEADGVKLFTSQIYAESLSKRVGDEATLKKYLESHIAHLQENDYFALLAYVEMNDETEKILQEIRRKVLETKLTATCLGFGPRFLHSTGQAYKGGANNGVFLQITTDDAQDFAVPHQKYTFGVVKSAQARGDFQVLLDRERRALRVHTGANVVESLKKILSLVS